MTRKARFLGILKYLLPKNNSWTKRLCLLFSFIFLDYLVTLIFCSAPVQEANTRARVFMELYGIPLGLTMFNVLLTLPIYMTLSLDSHFVRLPSPWSKTAEFFLDVTFALFIAAPHFNGATSWFWRAPETLRWTLGACIYLIFAFSCFRNGSETT